MADQRIEPILAKSAAPGAAAIPAPVVVVAVPKLGRPKRLGQLLERENVLAGGRLPPPPALLPLFLAYPLGLRVLPAVPGQAVGVPGEFGGVPKLLVEL